MLTDRKVTQSNQTKTKHSQMKPLSDIISTIISHLNYLSNVASKYNAISFRQETKCWKFLNENVFSL